MLCDVLADILARQLRSVQKLTTAGGISGPVDTPLIRLCLHMLVYLRMITLALAVACMAPDSTGQTGKDSIEVPPQSRLLLRAVGSGEQIYDCQNGGWVLHAANAKLLNEEGSVIGRHFAGPTWQLNDGSSVKGKAVAKKAAPDATAVPWLLLESVGGTGNLRAVRFIQRTETHGGNPPDGGCSGDATSSVPYTATYSFYEAEQ